MNEDTRNGKHFQAVKEIRHDRDRLAEDLRKDIEDRISEFARETGMTVKTIVVRIHEGGEFGLPSRRVDTFVELYV